MGERSSSQSGQEHSAVYGPALHAGDGRLPHASNVAFHIVFIVVSASAIAVQREWYHKVVILVAAASFVAYIVVLFARLH